MTLGLYNCYDPKQWHEIMRITLARAAPVALAFDCDVASFGFPFEQARRRGATKTESLGTPREVARFVAEGTSIGEGGEYFQELAKSSRFSALPFSKDGADFPQSLGRIVATTPRPEAAKATTPLAVAAQLVAGTSQVLLFGLGPRGLPAHVLDGAAHHLELTGKGISMETATALGALPALISAHMIHLGKAAH